MNDEFSWNLRLGRGHAGLFLRPAMHPSSLVQQVEEMRALLL